MKLKFKLSAMVIAIVVVIVVVVAVVLLNTASGMAVNLNVDAIEYIGETRAQYWKGREDARLKVIHTLADVMADYERIPVKDRRAQYDEMIAGVFAANPDLVNLYTVWKPNAIDGMDADYIGRTGSTPTGQYAMTYSRETGAVTNRTTVDIEASMAYFNGPNSKKDRVLTPEARKIHGNDTYALRFMAPIINPRTHETVGGVGCIIDIGGMQTALEETIANNEAIAAMAIYDNTGFVLSHYVPERIGKNMRDVDRLYGEHVEDAFKKIQKGEAANFNSYSDMLDSNIEIRLTPFPIGTSDMTWTVMIAATEDYMLLEVHQMTRFAVILAAIAIIMGAAIVF